MFGEFKEFIKRGNVLDLAVAVIMGAAFATISTSLTEDIIMPLVGAVFGNVDFSSQFLLLGSPPAEYQGAMDDYAALKAAGVPMLGWGQFLTVLINFLILAFAIFLMVKYANKLLQLQEENDAPSEIDLLTEIRDNLKK